MRARSEYCSEKETCTNIHTTVEGIPSTRINRRNFFVASSMSAAERAFDALLNWFSILLNECAVAAAEGSEEVDMRGSGGSGRKRAGIARLLPSATFASGRSPRRDLPSCPFELFASPDLVFLCHHSRSWTCRSRRRAR